MLSNVCMYVLTQLYSEFSLIKLGNVHKYVFKLQRCGMYRTHLCIWNAYYYLFWILPGEITELPSSSATVPDLNAGSVGSKRPVSSMIAESDTDQKIDLVTVQEKDGELVLRMSKEVPATLSHWGTRINSHGQATFCCGCSPIRPPEINRLLS